VWCSTKSNSIWGWESCCLQEFLLSNNYMSSSRTTTCDALIVHSGFRQEDFWKLHFENLIFDPVTYLCNQLKQFEQLWQRTTQGSFLWSLVKIQWVVLEEKLFKEIVDAPTHGRTHGQTGTMDEGQWAITKAHLEHSVLRWA